MKQIIKKSCMLVAATLVLASCKKFEEINVNPVAANDEQAQVEYFINGSIIGAQMNPDVAERSFVLYWKAAGRQMSEGGTLTVGNYNDQWTSVYYDQISTWLNSANTAIQLADKQTAAGLAKPHTPNLVQVARIWRAYLMSEMSDNFGPIPVNAFTGTNPEFDDVKTVYYHILAELADASQKLDLTVKNPSGLDKQDPAFGYDYAKWRKYANSLRMRLAMRLSEADPAKAQAEFEAVMATAGANNDFITNMNESFQVQEKDGWSDLSGVMSRSWNAQPISATINNLMIGLGGIRSADLLDAKFAPYIKPANWLGQSYPNHFATKTNAPGAGYWFNGLPEIMDPRAYVLFSIPGDIENVNFPDQNTNDTITTRFLRDADGKDIKAINAKYSWNARINGAWGPKTGMNLVYNFTGAMPRINMQFRTSTNKRVFFGPWETYFLIAEAAVRGWNTPMTGQVAYETAIQKSFEYNGAQLGSYLTSESYNRVGTSVAWNHITEPTSRVMEFEDGFTGARGTTTVAYPKNDLYKNGAVKNDHLTKIITQKFIAQTPWLPLETWNDHRRTGLPFFENPAIEIPIQTLPALTDATYMTSNVQFFPQRLRYPSNLKNTNAAGYGQALSDLGGKDEVLTPLWWAKK
jgi:hypothetical protein